MTINSHKIHVASNDLESAILKFFFFLISKANCIKTEARSYKAYRGYTKQLAPLKAKRRPTKPHHPLIGR